MDAVREEFKDGIYTIILNRPEKKNAMDSELLPALFQALQNARAKKSSVVIIRGAGKAFCAGGDIVEFRESEDTGSRIDYMADVLHKSIVLIRQMDAIVVAAVEGVAVGAGLGLALACDVTAASRNTVMNMGYRRIDRSANLLIIAGAGGAFGAILKMTQLTKMISENFVFTGIGLLLPFLIAAAIKTVNGSSFISIITAASVSAALIPSMGIDPAFAAAAVSAGSMVVSHANDRSEKRTAGGRHADD